MIDSSSKKIVYRKTNGRLAQYKNWTNSPTDWDNQWVNTDCAKLLSKKGTDLGEYDIIKNYLSKEGKILEAGCGNGNVVQALSLCGYNVEGIDYAEHTINQIEIIAPNLKVRHGNIFSIDVPDNTYGAYISLGVLEHNIEGPMDGLREAYRVLQPWGIGIFSVPFLNISREKKLAKLNSDIATNPSLNFYQYFFSQKDFSQFLNKAGFEIIDVIPIGLYYGLRIDNPIFALLDEYKFIHWRLKKHVMSICAAANIRLRWKHGHMLLFIGKKF